MTTYLQLQGIYRWGKRLVYFAYCPGNDLWSYQNLYIGTKVGSYNDVKIIPNKQLFLILADPVVLTHLMPGTVVSDSYPEYFI